MRKGAVLDCILTSKEGLVGDVKVKGILGCSDHKMVEFSIMRGRSRAKSNITGLDFGLFRYLLGRVPWDKALEGRGVQEDWLIFKEHHLQAKEQFIQTSRKSSKVARWPAWIEEQLLPKLKPKKEVYRRQKQRQVTWEEYRDSVQAC